MIYMDNAAAERPLPCALAALADVAASSYANPNAAHGAGRDAHRAIRAARETVARCLDCLPEEVYFTSTATAAAEIAAEAVQTVTFCARFGQTEHASISRLKDWFFYQDGAAPTAHFRMLANNETGEIYPKPPIPARDLWVCDATAAVGHIPVSVSDIGCDYLIADGLKFGAVPGAAILIARSGAPKPAPTLGTPSAPLIAALEAALQFRTENFPDSCREMQALTQHLWERLTPIGGIRCNTDAPTSRVLPHILSVSIDGVEGAALAAMLSHRFGVMVSTGAACSSGTGEPSRVLLASGIPEERAASSIRLSICPETTPEEVEAAALAISSCVAVLRDL